MTPLVFAPQEPKKREKTLFWGLLILGLGATLVARIPEILFPAGLQMVGAVALVCAAMIFTQCLLRRYVYRVEMGENGTATTGYPDFTVTEYTGNRMRVVCRISVDEVESVERITPENKERLTKEMQGHPRYRYTGVLFSENVYLLRIRGSGEYTYLQILANKDLIDALLRR